jgi:hypothetical protein
MSQGTILVLMLSVAAGILISGIITWQPKSANPPRQTFPLRKIRTFRKPEDKS